MPVEVGVYEYIFSLPGCCGKYPEPEAKVKLSTTLQVKLVMDRQGSAGGTGQSIFIVPELEVVFPSSIKKYSVTPLVSDTVIAELVVTAPRLAHEARLQV